VNLQKLAPFGLLLGIVCAGAAPAASVERLERGNLVTEGLPALDAGVVEKLARYQNVRGATLQGVLQDGSLLVTTRFGETAQLHRIAQPMGARTQLSFYPEPVAGALVHPRLNGFLFAKDKGGDEFFQYYWHDLETAEVRLLTDGKSRHTGALWSRGGKTLAYSTTARNGKDVDIRLTTLETAPESRPLVEKGGEWTALDFSPDGSTVIVRRGISINESELYLVDVATRAMTRFHPTKTPVYFGDAKFSADGNRIYYTSDEDSEFRLLRVEDGVSGNSEIISSKPYWNVEDFRLSENGRYLAYIENADGLSTLRMRNLKTGRTMAAPKLPIGVLTGLDFAASGNDLALSIDTALSPSDAYVWRVGSGSLVRWSASEVGGLNSKRFIAPELVRYKSFDGEQIPAFVYRAKRADGKKAPVLINIHGGPEAQALPSFTPTFQFYTQELGVAVITPNVRGSDGYGKRYLKLDNAMLREDSVRDIGALLDWVATQPDLDKDRVIVMGGSYGGYMTLASMTHYNDRLRAGVDIVGISHFGTFLKNTQDYRRDLRRVEYGDERIPEMAAFFEKIAPLNNAAKITKPMFIIQGLNDPRVPTSEAEQMVQKIRSNGGDVWYLLAKDEGHGFRKKSNRDLQAAYTVQFVQKTLLAD
jgi:dipeptidyl aminopeptidase/acylaminoacyl peptidase